MRLFSMDHADLFVTNERHSFTNKMIRGIPHSLLLSNLRGEHQLLVPVVPPRRPRVETQPFSTELVLERSNKEWLAVQNQRYYLYPVHVSLSFLMTKGINSALYLLLLRMLHRDYDSAYRLVDSVANDTKLSPEGVLIFDALKIANGDFHPDAHSVRLKVSLVTIDSDANTPWDLTQELAHYISKLPHVSATCRLSEREELQLLESDAAVKDDSSPNFSPQLHDQYSMALVKNRLHALQVFIPIARRSCSTMFRTDPAFGATRRC